MMTKYILLTNDDHQIYFILKLLFNLRFLLVTS